MAITFKLISKKSFNVFTHMFVCEYVCLAIFYQQCTYFLRTIMFNNRKFTHVLF